MDIDSDIMTPLKDYLISYGAVGSTHSLTPTLVNTSTEYKLFIPEGTGDIVVGVAARNSVGSSEFTNTTVSTTGKSSSPLGGWEVLSMWR